VTTDFDELKGIEQRRIRERNVVHGHYVDRHRLWYAPDEVGVAWRKMTRKEGSSERTAPQRDAKKTEFLANCTISSSTERKR